MGGATLAAAIAGTTGGAGAGVFDFSSGSGSVTIPSLATGVTIEVWGAGGGGGYGTVTNIFGEFAYEPQENPGGGGGGGAYAKTVLVLTAPDAGKTILYTVGAAGNGGSLGDAVGGAGGQSVAYAGTYALPEMICTGGFGGYGGIGIYGSQQGAGGTALGGNTTNTNGNGGAAFTQPGATPIAGVGSLVGGAGGDGGDPVEGGDPGKAGSNGRVRLKFTF
jgi:MSHA biogenesis protein MshQ